MSLSANSPLSVDRPDVTKSQAKPTLSFKEVRDSLFKFLMQAEVPFSEAERVSIRTHYKTKPKIERTTSPFGKRRYTTVEESVEVPLENHNFYKITCKLRDLTVNGLPVYIVAVPSKFEDLPNRQKNRLKILQSQHNVIIFDEYDWNKLNLDISDKNWLAPLTRPTMKSWARILFKKISALGGRVKSKFTLNDLFTHIDRNTATKASSQTVQQRGEVRIQRLRGLLISQIMKNVYGLDMKETHEKILTEFSSMDASSLKWIEDLLSSILQKCINKIDLRRTVYKELFRRVNGEINPVNSEALASLVYEFLTKEKRGLEVENLGHGILRVQNKTTFQSVNIALFPTKSQKLKSVSIFKGIAKKKELIFGISVSFTKGKSKPTKLDGFIILTTNCNKGYTYSSNYRMPIPIDKRNNCDLWSDI